MLFFTLTSWRPKTLQGSHFSGKPGKSENVRECQGFLKYCGKSEKVKEFYNWSQ